MRARTFVSIAVISALGVLTPMQSYAFGLGKIELSSALNEPFRAVIPVTALRDDDGEPRVKLASNLEFEKAGLQRSFLLTQLNFDVVEKNGKTTINISSTQPVKEPFLDFLLTVATSSGRLIREYTVLLDPPESVFVKHQSTKKVNNSIKTEAKSPKNNSYESPASEPAYTTNNYYDGASYTVGKYDTLWSIAKKTKPQSSISVNQMMMALLNANPSAFQNNNINNLIAGQTLTIPSLGEIEQLSKAQANSAVKEQSIGWNNRNKEITSITETSEQLTDSATQNDAGTQSEDLVSGNEDHAARLKLIAPADAQSDAAELSPLGDAQLEQLSVQLTLAQETIESQAQENTDIKSRMDVMEEQVQTLRRLISLKDADLAKMQSTLQAEGELTGLTEDEMVELGDGQEEFLVLADDDLVAAQEDLVELEGDGLAPDQDGLVELEDAAQEELIELGDGDLIALQEGFTELEDDNLIAIQEDLELDGVSSPSEVDAYFAQLDSGEGEVQTPELGMDDEFALIPLEEGLDQDVLIEIENPTDDIGELQPDVVNNTELSLLDKVKGFFSEHKSKGLIAGVLALLAIIGIAVKARKKEEFEWEEDVSSTSATVGAASESETNLTEEPHETTVAIDKIYEDIDNDAYGSLDADEGEIPTLEPHGLESDNLSSEEQLELDEKINNTLLQENETVILDGLMDEVPELGAESTELEFNLDDFSGTPDVEEKAETENKISKDDEMLDFDLGVSPETSLDAESLEDIAVPSEDSDSEGLEFDSTMMIDSDESPSDDDGLSFDLGDDNLNDDALSFDLGDENLNDAESFELDLDADDTDLNSLSLDDDAGLDSLSLDDDAGLDSLSLDIDDADLDSLSLDISDSGLDSLSLDGDDELVEFEVADSGSASIATPVATSDLEFDLGNFDEIDEAETKLDLAGAYIDMGDSDGARSILEEVLVDGDSDQKDKAQALINRLT